MSVDARRPDGPGYGLGIQTGATPCGTFWGHDGGIPGYLTVTVADGAGPRRGGLRRDPRGRARTAATLRAAVAWSWDLLDADERALLERLSVVPGAFGEDAAEAIAGVISGAGDARELLAALVEADQGDQPPPAEQLGHPAYVVVAAHEAGERHVQVAVRSAGRGGRAAQHRQVGLPEQRAGIAPPTLVGPAAVSSANGPRTPTRTGPASPARRPPDSPGKTVASLIRLLRSARAGPAPTPRTACGGRTSSRTPDVQCVLMIRGETAFRRNGRRW